MSSKKTAAFFQGSGGQKVAIGTMRVAGHVTLGSSRLCSAACYPIGEGSIIMFAVFVFDDGFDHLGGFFGALGLGYVVDVFYQAM